MNDWFAGGALAEDYVVFDTAGGDTLDRSWSVLKHDGRMVTIGADTENIR